MDTPEFGDMLTRRINYIQDTQHLMMERLNAQEDRIKMELVKRDNQMMLFDERVTKSFRDVQDGMKALQMAYHDLREDSRAERATLLDTIKTGDTEKLTRKLLASTNAVREKLWNFFSEEYFLFLRKSANRAKAHSKLQPAVGQVVLVSKDLVKRHKWPIGLIQELITSSDGKVRSVMVKVGKNVVERSVNQLIPLEVPNEFPTPPEDTPERDQLQEFPQSAEESSHPASQHKLSHRKRPYLHRKAKEVCHQIVMPLMSLRRDWLVPVNDWILISEDESSKIPVI